MIEKCQGKPSDVPGRMACELCRRSWEESDQNHRCWRAMELKRSDWEKITSQSSVARARGKSREQKPLRQQALDAAGALINGDREKDYGKPSTNFGNIASRWSQFLGVEVKPWQVCLMMADLKIARIANGYHEDSVVDAIGYIALAKEVKQGEEPEE